jgi:hypothetical protein
MLPLPCGCVVQLRQPSDAPTPMEDAQYRKRSAAEYRAATDDHLDRGIHRDDQTHEDRSVFGFLARHVRVLTSPRAPGYDATKSVLACRTAPTRTLDPTRLAVGLIDWL